MSYGIEFLYAMGKYYISPDNVLHIEPTMPEEMRSRFIEEMTQVRDETRERNARFEFSSRDIYWDTIQFDD